MRNIRIPCFCITLFLWICPPLIAATINVPADQPTIQAGINAAVSGSDEVVVASGTYNEIINFNGKAITVRSAGGPDVTTIDGTGLGDTVVRVDSGEFYTITVLDGFTITGGSGDTSVVPGESVGGGAFIYNSGLSIRNCIFTGNSANSGGGMWVKLGYPLVVINCLFENNSATGMPGTGGGIHFVNNNALWLENCTFSGNTAFSGGGVSLDNTGSVEMTNCIFWMNSDSGGMDESAQIDDPMYDAVVFTSCVQGWTGFGGGNISADPSFVTGPKGNFYLSQIASGQGGDSPCLDAAPNYAYRLYLSGTTRTDGVDDAGRVDMGFHYDATFRTLLTADLDSDDDVDANDFLTWGECFNGSLNPPHLYYGVAVTAAADEDNDGDVDTHDFLTFSNCFNGALVAPYCDVVLDIGAVQLHVTSSDDNGPLDFDPAVGRIAYATQPATVPVGVAFSATTNGVDGSNNGVQAIYTELAGSAIIGVAQAPMTTDPVFIDFAIFGGLGFDLLSGGAGGTGGVGIIAGAGEPQALPGAWTAALDAPNVGHAGPVAVATGDVILSASLAPDPAIHTIDLTGDANLWEVGYGHSQLATTTTGATLEIVIRDPSDLDNDGDTDANDFLTFSNCFNGALNPPKPICGNLDADLDGDGDVDPNDFLTFSNCYNGSSNPPNCP